MSALVEYRDDGDEEEAPTPYDARDAFGLSTMSQTTNGASSSRAPAAPTASTSRPSAALTAAPEVTSRDIMQGRSSALVPVTATEIMVNLTHEQMSAPMQGPINPFSERRLEKMNTVNGFVEEHAMAPGDFERQQRAFEHHGFAHNPSEIMPVDPMTGAQLQPFVGDVHAAYQAGGSLIERPGRSASRALKRKRHAKGTLGVVEFDDVTDAADQDPNREREYVGPWAGWETEKIEAAIPTEEEYLEIEKKSFKRQTVDSGKDAIPFGTETSVFHGKSMRDYLGRTYMEAPKDAGVDFDPDEPGSQTCFVPKKVIHTWNGHQKGVAAIRLFPKTGHLFLSGSMDSNVKLWDIYNEGKCLRTFKGHAKAIRDLNFNDDGTRFLTASFDQQMKLWDTETGTCISAFTTEKVPNCIKFNPDKDKQDVFVAGMQDRKVVQFDIKSGEIVQTYSEHLGGVNSITFIDENRKFVTSSDDKTVRVWEWDIPVVSKYIADPSMHSMPTATISPDRSQVAMQSLDNQIMLFAADTMRMNRKKAYRGHATSGYACEVAWSPDGKYISSGDSGGRIHFWEQARNKKIMTGTLQVHNRALISHAWLPHETSKVITASWDSKICLLD